MWIAKIQAALIAVALAAAGFSSGPARAQSTVATAGPAPELACGFALSPSVMEAWRALGGASGRLGCATEREGPAPTAAGAGAARIAVFGANGEIVLHTDGPRAGQAFAVTGCFYRLYVQFSGTAGWLGLPLADAENSPDGSTQAFEGGTMRYGRAYDDCQATPAVQASAPASTTAEAEGPLDLYENPATGERLSLAARGSVDAAIAAGYRRLRAQGRVLMGTAPGTAPLKLFLDEDRGLRRTLATAQSEREALAAGFTFEAGQGFVWTEPRPGAVTLKLFSQPGGGRARLTAGDLDEREAMAAGLVFERIEGYAEPPS